MLGHTVGKTDHRQLLDVRTVFVEILDLVGIDVLAVGVDDDVLAAPDDVEVALFVEAAEVAGVEPAIADGVRGGLFVLPVPRHHVLAAGDDLADARVVGVGDLDLDASQRLAHRARDGLLLGRAHRQHGRSLGQAVALEEVEAHAVEHLQHVRRQCRAAADHVANAAAELLVHGQEQQHAQVDASAGAQLEVGVGQRFDARF
jgi:hypothetical protein